MLSQWISWARKRTNDKRPNPVYNRTTRSHIDAGNQKALCGLKIGHLVHEDIDRPKCPRCEKKARALIVAASQAELDEATKNFKRRNEI